VILEYKKNKKKENYLENITTSYKKNCQNLVIKMGVT